jgi:hypothetical protein
VFDGYLYPIYIFTQRDGYSQSPVAHALSRAARYAAFRDA